jgi:hypothetical protein
MKKVIFVLGAFLFSTGLNAQNPNHDQVSQPFIVQLLGNWNGKGNSFGKVADINFSCKEALDKHFFLVNYKLVMHVSDTSSQRFEGLAFYQHTKENEYTGTWFDNGGEVHPIIASDNGKELIATWGFHGKKLGKTIYSLKNNHTLEIIDYIFKNKDQVWVEFNRNIVKKSL